ncbi:MAG: DedA family protein [Betaproteobacteria bacterium]|nr:DedA family protein [Betaproteobacteria bacterium]
MATESWTRSPWGRRVLLTLFIIVTFPTVLFGLRAYHSLLVLRSAHELGAPVVSSVRAWMTIRYVAGAYRAPEAALIAQLQLAPGTDPDTELKTLAEREGVPKVEFVQRVQQALVAVAPALSASLEGKTTGWLGEIGEEFLSALLLYGYPALALTLLMGAIGLPLPTGLSAVLAGSLAAQARMSLLWAGSVAVAALVLGDIIAYVLGRVLGREFLERWGGWLGYTSARRDRIERLFDRWGVLTVLLSRTLVSHLSSVVSLLAGVGRYRLLEFMMYAIVGRVLWTTAYVGLGYAVGSDLDAAAGFLQNLTGFLVTLAALVGLGFAALSRPVN